MESQDTEPSGQNSSLVEKTREASELKKEIEAIKGQLELLQGKFTTISIEIINTLEAMDIDSVKTNGFNFYIEEKYSVKTPKTLEDKRELFTYLQHKGLFEEMVSVNSQTLNSFYKSMAEEAAGNGILDFKLPGVDEPTSFKTLKMRKI